MKPGTFARVAALSAGLFAGTADAASLAVTFYAPEETGTFLTLRYGNDTAGDTIFGASDFVSRSWAGLDVFGPQNLRDIVGLYPVSNLTDTAIAISGTINGSATGASVNTGFAYSETKAGLGFTPISLSAITGARLRGPAMWTAIDGFFPNFYLISSDYDANGTASSVAPTSAAPLPAAAPLALAAFGLLAFIGRRRG